MSDLLGSQGSQNQEDAPFNMFTDTLLGPNSQPDNPNGLDSLLGAMRQQPPAAPFGVLVPPPLRPPGLGSIANAIVAARQASALGRPPAAAAAAAAAAGPSAFRTPASYGTPATVSSYVVENSMMGYYAAPSGRAPSNVRNNAMLMPLTTPMPFGSPPIAYSQPDDNSAFMFGSQNAQSSFLLTPAAQMLTPATQQAQLVSPPYNADPFAASQQSDNSAQDRVDLRSDEQAAAAGGSSAAEQRNALSSASAANVREYYPLTHNENFQRPPVGTPLPTPAALRKPSGRRPAAAAAAAAAAVPLVSPPQQQQQPAVRLSVNPYPAGAGLGSVIGAEPAAAAAAAAFYPPVDAALVPLRPIQQRIANQPAAAAAAAADLPDEVFVHPTPAESANALLALEKEDYSYVQMKRNVASNLHLMVTPGNCTWSTFMLLPSRFLTLVIYRGLYARAKSYVQHFNDLTSRKQAIKPLICVMTDDEIDHLHSLQMRREYKLGPGELELLPYHNMLADMMAKVNHYKNLMNKKYPFSERPDRMAERNNELVARGEPKMDLNIPLTFTKRALVNMNDRNSVWMSELVNAATEAKMDEPEDDDEEAAAAPHRSRSHGATEGVCKKIAGWWSQSIGLAVRVPTTQEQDDDAEFGTDIDEPAPSSRRKKPRMSRAARQSAEASPVRPAERVSTSPPAQQSAAKRQKVHRASGDLRSARVQAAVALTTAVRVPAAAAANVVRAPAAAAAYVAPAAAAAAAAGAIKAEPVDDDVIIVSATFQVPETEEEREERERKRQVAQARRHAKIQLAQMRQQEALSGRPATESELEDAT